MKNAFAGIDYSLIAMAGSTDGLLLMNVWPFVAIFVTDGLSRTLYAAAAVGIVLIFGVVNGPKLGYVVAYPAAALLFTYILWRSALLAVTRGTIEWRSTVYPLAAMKNNRI